MADRKKDRGGFERDLEQEVQLRVWLLGVVFLTGIACINALTLITEAERSGAVLDWREPWILEITSVLALGLLVPGVAWLERRFPVTADNWRSGALAHLVGSMVFSAGHVLLMWALRLVLFRISMGRTYTFFDDPVADTLYEYRKDLLPYFIILLLLKLTRDVLEARHETQLARAEARTSGRLTIKSGGRVLMLDGESFAWASSAGNYVEVSVEGRAFLARTTLSALQAQLLEARIRVARIHRTLLVNQDHIREVRPAQNGDFSVRLADGTDLRGSRRYRKNIEEK